MKPLPLTQGLLFAFPRPSPKPLEWLKISHVWPPHNEYIRVNSACGKLLGAGDAIGELFAIGACDFLYVGQHSRVNGINQQKKTQID